MDNQIEDLMLEGGEELLSWLRTSGEFAVEQAPLLAEEIVWYGIFYNGSILLFTLVSFVLCVSLSYRMGRHKDAWPEMKHGGHNIGPRGGFCLGFAAIAFVVAVAFLAGGTTGVLPDFCKALVAPRLYIIEQIAGLAG